MASKGRILTLTGPEDRVLVRLEPEAPVVKPQLLVRVISDASNSPTDMPLPGTIRPEVIRKPGR
jgi:hypothetical protein